MKKKLQSLKDKKFGRSELALIKGSGLAQGPEEFIKGDCTTLNLTTVRATGEVKREPDSDDSDWAQC
ncbi:TPA: hypothetical protein ACGZ92_003567 [Elizabethkingia anophelis]